MTTLDQAGAIDAHDRPAANSAFTLPLFASALFVSALAFGSLPGLPNVIKFQRRQSTPAPRPRQSFLAGLQAAGYGHLDVDEIIQLHNHGVAPQFMAEISAVTGKLRRSAS